jgi:CheY-like chemotaxis protein
MDHLGFRVTLCLSTAEAMSRLSSEKYDGVITDMGRVEGTYKATAGLDLIKAVRSMDQHIPIVVYTTGRAIEKYGVQR